MLAFDPYALMPLSSISREQILDTDWKKKQTDRYKPWEEGQL